MYKVVRLYSPGTGCPFRRFLRLAGIWFRYSNPLPHGSRLVVEVTVRPTVSRPLCLGIKHPSGAYGQLFITVRQLRVCWCGALSLTRGRVCRLRLLVALASAVILKLDSRGPYDHIFCLRFDTALTWRARSPCLYLSGTGWPSYTLRHWVPSSPPPTTRRVAVEEFEPASTQGTTGESSHMLRPTVSRQVCLRIKDLCAAYDQLFITVRQLRVCWCGALSLTRGRVLYNCCWPSSAQLFLGSSPVGLATIFYCLRLETFLFVASYDSQGYSVGVRHRLRTGRAEQSSNLLPATSQHGHSWHRAPLEPMAICLFNVKTFVFFALLILW
jgi:hypothetical protein